MPKVFVSDAILQERLFTGSQISAHKPRQVLWGWKALSALYQTSLTACGFQITPVVRPEIYQTDIARKICGVEAGDWHLAVKPIEHLRPFHGIPNVFVCDWPFPELSAVAVGDSPFFDQARLLRMADAVLCCTDFTRDTLRAAGVDRATTLPPFIPSPPSPRREATGCRFLCMVDTDHLRRQLGSTIEGFALAARRHDALRLVVCVEGADKHTLASVRRHVARVDQGLDKIITVVAADSDGAAAALSASADFLLCADAAPGLRLRVVEAMLAGLPVVTTTTAGIESFLSQEAAVPIATRPGTLDQDDEPIARFLYLSTNPPTAEAVRDAVLVAAALDKEARFRMAKSGQASAATRFGLAAFREGLGQLAHIISVKSA